MGQLAEQVKKKYPGAYDGKTDAEIESAIIAKYPGKYDHLATGTKEKGLPPNITLPDGSIVSSAYKGGERKDRRFIDTDKLRESMITGASKTPFPRLIGGLGEIGIQGIDLFNDPESIAAPGLLKGVNSRVLPSKMPEVVAPRAVPNIAAEGMTGNREVIPVRPKTTELPTKAKAGDKVKKTKEASQVNRWNSPEGKRLQELADKDTAGKLTAEELAEAQKLNALIRGVDPLPSQVKTSRIRTNDPSEGRRIMEEISGKQRQGLDSEIGAIGDIDSVRKGLNVEVPGTSKPGGLIHPEGPAGENAKELIRNTQSRIEGALKNSIHENVDELNNYLKQGQAQVDYANIAYPSKIKEVIGHLREKADWGEKRYPDSGFPGQRAHLEETTNYFRKLADDLEANPTNENLFKIREEIKNVLVEDPEMHVFRSKLGSETGALNVTLPSMPNIHFPKGFGATDVINAPKAIGASLDVSFPGRQGLWMIGRKEWRKSWAPMMKSLVSEDAYRKLQDSITNHPKFTEAVNNGLSLTDFAGVAVPKGMKTKAIGRLAQQEEQFGTRLVEQFTGGKYSPFRASNRAYSAFANNLRMSMYDNLTNKATRIAQKGGGIADRKMIAEYINSGSGRGSMGLTVGGKSDTLDKATELLNTVFWSPRFLASRVQLMNVPGNLMKMDKFTRQEYLRDLVTSVTGGATVLGIANLAGASVNLDPLEADFAKIKIDNTRVDLTGGFGPLIRFISMGVNGVLDLDEKGAKGPDAWKFIESKLSPSARFFKEVWTGEDYFGRDISAAKAAGSMITPMIAKDFYELYQNDPELFPLGGLALVGAGVQSYKERGKKGKMPSLSSSFPKMPSISD